MQSRQIATEVQGDVGIIRLNRPATLNAVTLQMLEELTMALDEMVGKARAILLTGAGTAFCSGADLAGGMDIPTDDPAGPDFGLALETHVNPLITRLRDLPIPWITAVRGAAAGVGCSLALAGDLVVASETAYFMQAFVRIGLVPDGGSTHLLVRAIGRARAMEMMLLGKKLSAATALEWGLINDVVADDALDRSAFETAQLLARGPTRTLSMIRDLAWAALDADLPATLRMERDRQAIAGRSKDAGEGIAAFQAKRPALFTGA